MLKPFIMFGLMRSTCGDSDHKNSYSFRQSYCGTCKAIGSQFGQRSRMLLNFDAAFLGEILEAYHLKSATEVKTIVPFDCFDIPDQNSIPKSYRYASKVNMLFVALKAMDNEWDSPGLKTKLFAKIFKSKYDKVFPLFEDMNLPASKFMYWMNEQRQRELEDGGSMNFYSEATAQLTAMVFKQGMTAIGQEENEQFEKMGFAFGRLIYILDAFKDLKNDLKNDEFNPFRFLHLNNLEGRRNEVLRSMDGVVVCIERLDLPEEKKRYYISKLQMNLFRMLDGKPKQSCNTDSLPKPSKLFAFMRWQVAVSILFFFFISTQESLAAMFQVMRPAASDTFSTFNMTMAIILATSGISTIYLLGKRARYWEKVKRRIKRKMARLKRKQKGTDEEGKDDFWKIMVIILTSLLVGTLVCGCLLVESCCNAGSSGTIACCDCCGAAAGADCCDCSCGCGAC